MRPMMRLVVGVLVLVGILAAVAVGLPAHVTVTRSVVVNAPEYAVFPYLNDLHHFKDWSPWAARDPQMQISYSGPESGKGAHVDWTSEQASIGTGSMEIIDSEPSRHLDLVVNFNGLEGTSAFDIAPAGAGSKVTWNFGYDSGSSPLKRWKGLMLDGFVGAEYRAGLDKLKERIEADRRPMAPATGTTPPTGGVSTEAEQPAAALPPGATVPPGQTVVPQTTPPATGAPPAAGTPPAAAQAAPPPAPAAEAVAPAPQPAPKPKSKRRRSQ
jgi:hypothetical protein